MAASTSSSNPQQVSGLAMADADPEEFNSLLGARVVLHGLTARPELNGRNGRVMSWHEAHGRAGVRLDGEQRSIAIKPANLSQTPVKQEAESAPRVLTVGDGDLSYSVALARAFGSTIQLTATTLLSEAELLETYAASRVILDELNDRGVCVRHGIDATSLESASPPLGPQDHVLFNHPHLGLADLRDVQVHARRHEVLVAHYLASAAIVSAEGGCIHLTLCGNQPRAWSVSEHSRRLGLPMPEEVEVALPIASAGLVQLSTSGEVRQPLMPLRPPEDRWAARRRFRNGTLGSKHWLGRYGYEHRRSEGDMDMNVDRSVELVWRTPSMQPRVDQPEDRDRHECPVCGFVFPTANALAKHVVELGVPQPVAMLREWRQKQQQVDSSSASATVADRPSLPTPTANSSQTTPSMPAGHVCVHCGATLASRNQLFKHLGAGCDTAAPRTREVVRIVLLVAYLGENFHGAFYSEHSDHSTRPTVGGRLLQAARRAWESRTEASKGEAQSARSDVADQQRPSSEITICPLVRTEKQVSALQNWFLLTIPRKPTSAEALVFEEDLGGCGIFLLSARCRAVSSSEEGEGGESCFAVTADFNSLNRPFPRWLLPQLKRSTTLAEAPVAATPSEPRMMTPLADTPLDLRHAAKRFVYKYALPYALLLLPEERPAEHDSCQDHTSGGRGDSVALPAAADDLQLCCTVWLWGLGDSADQAGLLLLLSSFELVASETRLPTCGGYCKVQFSSAGAAIHCVEMLNGKEWYGRELLAMLAADARQKLAVHDRVKLALKRLTGDEAASATLNGEDVHCGVVNETDSPQSRSGPMKRRPRSFHNFCSDKARLRGASREGHHLHLVLDNCHSAIQEDLRNPERPAASGAYTTTWANWDCGDWLVVSFSAREFAPQQVRRMAGLLSAVVSGAATSAYIDRCFAEAEVPTPLAPAECMWLERIQLSPRAQQTWVTATRLKVDAVQHQAARLEVERHVRTAGVQPFRRFATELASKAGFQLDARHQL